MSEENENHRSGQPDPEKVNERIQDILANRGSAGQVPLHLSDDVVERLAARDAVSRGELPKAVEKEAEEDTEEDKDPDRGRESKTFNQSTPENSGIKAWALQMPALTKTQVTPTQTDKMRYLKAMLNDVEVEFDISLPVGGLTMKIRSLNNHEQDVIFKALEKDQQDDMVAGPAQYVTRLQYYTAVMQILEYNKAKQDVVRFTPDDAYATTDTAADHLREATNKYIGANNWPTWQVKLTGLRIFEEKLGACNRSVIDANFWTPAGTD